MDRPSLSNDLKNPIVIIDDQQPHNSLTATQQQKQGILSPSKNTISPKPNSFNFEFLKVSKVTKESVEGAQKSTKSSTMMLEIEETEETISINKAVSKVINYSVEGSRDRRLRTADLNLLDKLEVLEGKRQAARLKNEQIALLAVEDANQKNSQERSEPEEAADEEKDQSEEPQVMRYFTTVEEKKKFGKCRRCKKDGHFQRNCTEQVRINCHYCLGNHTKFDCDRQQICFRCNREGHMMKVEHSRMLMDCKVVAMRCHKCHKNGHKESECGVIIFYDELKNENYTSHDLKRLRCLACQEKGHLNCNKVMVQGHDGLYISETDGVEMKKTYQGRKSHKKDKKRGRSPIVLEISEEEEEEEAENRKHRKKHNHSRNENKHQQKHNRNSHNHQQYDEDVYYERGRSRKHQQHAHKRSFNQAFGGDVWAEDYDYGDDRAFNRHKIHHKHQHQAEPPRHHTHSRHHEQSYTQNRHHQYNNQQHSRSKDNNHYQNQYQHNHQHQRQQEHQRNRNR